MGFRDSIFPGAVTATVSIIITGYALYSVNVQLLENATVEVKFNIMPSIGSTPNSNAESFSKPKRKRKRKFNPIVTSLGRITGSSVICSGKTVHTFFGIPYATPPTGRMRFQRPRAVEPWSEVLNATKFAPACLMDFEKLE